MILLYFRELVVNWSASNNDAYGFLSFCSMYAMWTTQYTYYLIQWKRENMILLEDKFWIEQMVKVILGSSFQFSSVTQSCPTLCHPMNGSTPGLPVHHQLLEFTQTHVHWVGDAIQPSHPLSSPSPPALNLSQHQGLFQWVSSSHQVAKVLEFQLQNQSFQWTPRTDLL